MNQAEPRAWSNDEIALVRGAADRCWAETERAKAEAALRESQTQLAAAFESVSAAVTCTPPSLLAIRFANIRQRSIKRTAWAAQI